MEWLREELGYPWSAGGFIAVVVGAASCSDEEKGLDILRYARDRGCDVSTHADQAAWLAGYRGHWRKLEWMRGEGGCAVIHPGAHAGAAAAGRLDVMQRLLSEGVAPDWRAELGAVDHRRPEPILTWLWAHGLDVGSGVVRRVAKKGRADVLRWMCEESPHLRRWEGQLWASDPLRFQRLGEEYLMRAARGGYISLDSVG